MAGPHRYQDVYKVVGKSEIDANIFLPPEDSSPCPVGRLRPSPCSHLLSDVISVINIHGGAFMLGASEMVNQDQIEDCVGRRWIVVVPNHRLCPQVDLLEGPMLDCRDLLAWIYDGGLERSIRVNSYQHRCDLDHVFAFGTSSGGHLALCLVWSFTQTRISQTANRTAPCRDLASPVLLPESWTITVPATSTIPSGRRPSRISPQCSPQV